MFQGLVEKVVRAYDSTVSTVVPKITRILFVFLLLLLLFSKFNVYYLKQKKTGN
jgi:hypothetical protein